MQVIFDGVDRSIYHGYGEKLRRLQRKRPVRIGLPGWARTSLVGRLRLTALVTLRTRAGCGAGRARRVALRR